MAANQNDILQVPRRLRRGVSRALSARLISSDREDGHGTRTQLRPTRVVANWPATASFDVMSRSEPVATIHGIEHGERSSPRENRMAISGGQLAGFHTSSPAIAEVIADFNRPTIFPGHTTFDGPEFVAPSAAISRRIRPTISAPCAATSAHSSSASSRRASARACRSPGLS